MVEGRITDWSEEAQGQMPDAAPKPSRVKNLIFESTSNKIQFAKNTESNMDGGKYKIFYKDGEFSLDKSDYDLLTEINHDGAPATIEHYDASGSPGRQYLVIAETSTPKESIETSPIWWPDPNYFCLVWVKHADINLSPKSDMSVSAELKIGEGTLEEFGPFLIIVSSTIETFQKDTVNGEFTALLVRSSKLPGGAYYKITIKGGGADRTFDNKKVPDLITEALINLPDA